MVNPLRLCINTRTRSLQNKNLYISRCKCGTCSVEFVVKPDECRCCFDIEQCKMKMAEVNLNGRCLTEHPAFECGCLNPWVLRIAGVGFKTRIKGAKNYTALYKKGKKTENE